MIEQIRATRDAALARLADAASSDDVRTLELEVLGRKGRLTDLKAGLGALPTVDAKKAAGQALNEAAAEVSAALAARLGEFRRAEREVQLQAERLDLTEVLRAPRRGHAHVVTQAWQRLEDVFVGLGFQVAGVPTGFAIMAIWIAGGICALCGALSYAELGAALPSLGRVVVPALTFVTFALVYKLLPDAHVRWRDIWPGALLAISVRVVVLATL